jgi:hypothetical protein
MPIEKLSCLQSIWDRNVGLFNDRHTVEYGRLLTHRVVSAQPILNAGLDYSSNHFT